MGFVEHALEVLYSSKSERQSAPRHANSLNTLVWGVQLMLCSMPCPGLVLDVAYGYIDSQLEDSQLPATSGIPLLTNITQQPSASELNRVPN